MCIFAPQNWTFEKFEYMKTSALFGTASYDLLVGNSGAGSLCQEPIAATTRGGHSSLSLPFHSP